MRVRGGETCRRDAHPATSSSSTTTTRRRRRSREEVHKIYAPPYEMCGAKRVRNSLYSIRGANMECLAGVCVSKECVLARRRHFQHNQQHNPNICKTNPRANIEEATPRSKIPPFNFSVFALYAVFHIYIYALCI